MKKISKILYLLITLILIAGIGLFTALRLIDFYVEDETVNNEWTADMGSPLETDIASNFVGRYSFVDLNGGMRRLLGIREMNGVIKLNNGNLFMPFAKSPDETLESYAGLYAQLDGWADEIKGSDVPLLYCTVPYSSDKYDPMLPAGIEDYGNDDLDRFLSFLREKNVDTMDFREEFHKDGYSAYDMMYRTDHHWTTEAGLYAYGKIEDYLVEKLGCEVDPRIRDISNYTVTTYPKWHLGSYGQRTGSLFAGIDDFDLIEPDFETSITNGTETGTFSDLVLNLEPLSSRDFHSRYTYDAVLDKALGNYRNLNARNDKKLLVITDSFGKAVCPYLIMGFGEMRYMYDGTILDVTPEYLREYQPDAIIVISYVGIIPGLMEL